MAIRILIEAEDEVKIPRRLLRRGVEAALASAPVTEGELSLTLVDDAGIRKLNRRYLDRDRPTDVLAFRLYEEGEPFLGDVYVGLDRARRQATEMEVSLEEELVRLAIHGTLHVLGHDHPEGPDREECEMFRLQEELVARTVGSGGKADGA